MSRLSRGLSTRRLAVLMIVSLALPGLLHAQAELSLGDESVMPAGTVEVSLMLATNPQASAIQVDVLFDSSKLTAGVPIPGGGLGDHLLASVEPEAGVLRLVLYSPTNQLLPIGEVARIPFTAAATPGLEPLDPEAGEVATPAAVVVMPLTLTSGSVHVFNLEADLELDLTAGSTLVKDGDPLSYTLMVSNPGPDGVIGVGVTDLAPMELVAFTWSCVASGGATCAAAGIGDLTDTVDLPVGGTVVYTLDGIVDTASSFIDNHAELESTAEVFDPDTANNSDSVTVDVCTVDHEVLTGWDIGGVAIFNACVTLTAGPDFNIQPTGDVTLRALVSVALDNDFSIESGGTLTVEIP